MKKGVSILFVLTILITATYNVVYGSTLKVVYVSSSEGDDSNSGQTPDAPLRTIKKAGSFMPDTIYLKRGDIFYESIKYGRSSLIGYGKGAMPVLSGYKRIIRQSWEKVGDNVWKLNLTEDNFTGYQVEGSSYLNNIGCIHEYDKDIIHGNRVEHLNQLNDDWDIWQCEGHGKDLPASAFDEIYLYLSTNPNSLQLEFSVNVCGANMYEKHPIIDGIRFEGFNTAVNFNMSGDMINCRIDAMGGNLFLTNIYGFVCAGNGIQYWVGRYHLDNSVAKGNYITRCYDCGITIQGDGSVSPKNITIADNLITNCCQGWEDFIHNDDAFYDNCVFKDNLVVFSGESGWGYPASRFKYCHILQNNCYGSKGMIFQNNTFIGGNYYCSEPCGSDYKSAVWRGNVCYIEQGDFLTGRYHGNGDIVRVPKYDNGRRVFLQERDNAIDTYRAMVNDSSTKFVIVSPKKAKRIGNKAIKKYLKKHSY